MRNRFAGIAAFVRVLVCCFSAGTIWAQSSVSLTVNARFPGLAIAPDFGVFSFETGSLQYGNKNYNADGYFFNNANSQLVTIFKNLGVKSIRIGGDSVDGSYIPSTADLDSFYGFLAAAGVKSVFSLDLAGGTPSEDASEAAYIWDHYATNTLCFAVGNEPDEYGSNDPAITNFTSFISIWQNFATAVTAAAPNALLGGPDNDSAANSWAPDFVQAEETNASVRFLHYHYKPLGNAAAETPQQLVAGELSSSLDTSDYPSCYNIIAVPALSAGFSYRFTEFNDYYVGSAGTTNMDDFFATALFALDALHWWASNGCLGLHFHTGVQGFHAAFYIDGNGNYQLFPLSYGIAAFNVGACGDVTPLTMTNSDALNLTAYAAENGTNLYITIINRENGGGARNAAVTITPNGFAAGNVAAMFLIQTNGNVTASNGITLGGTTISGSAPWQGQWMPLGSLTNGQCAVSVPAASAAIVRIQAATFAPPAIVHDLPAQVALLPGQTYQYSIGVNGFAPLNYQWYRDAAPIERQTNATLTVTAGSPGNSAYNVVIADNYGSVTSSISTLTIIAPATNSFVATLRQFNPAGYWPMHEVEPAVPGDIETNYGTLGLLGTGYYPDWAANYGGTVHGTPGALAGDADAALHFTHGTGNSGSTVFYTNGLYVPLASPLAVLNPPFSVECWFYPTNAPTGEAIWSQNGAEGLNTGAKGGQVSYNGLFLNWANGTFVPYGFNEMNGGFANANKLLAGGNNGGSPAEAVGNWYQVVVTCDATTNFTLYVNGSLSAGTSPDVGKYAPDYWTPISIGCGYGNLRSSAGFVDEFAVYATNLSLTQIYGHYSAGTNAGPGNSYFHVVTNDNPMIYLRLDAPNYSAPPVSIWPTLTNCGSAGASGIYVPGAMPGIAPGPAPGLYPALAGLFVPQFSGVSSFADAGYAPAFNPTGSNANFTVMAFFRGNPCDNRVQSIAGHGTNSWELDISTNGCIVFNAGNGNGAGGGTGQAAGDLMTAGVYNDSNWHEVVAVNQTNMVSLYVDGQLDTGGSPAGVTPISVIHGNLDDVMIGSDPVYTNNPPGVGRNFAGQICDVAFFTNALTATQIQTIYSSAITPLPESLSSIREGSGELQLNWIYGTLQEATNVGGPYQDVTNASPYIVPMTNSQEFYRIMEN